MSKLTRVRVHVHSVRSVNQNPYNTVQCEHTWKSTRKSPYRTYMYKVILAYAVHIEEMQQSRQRRMSQDTQYNDNLSCNNWHQTTLSKMSNTPSSWSSQEDQLKSVNWNYTSQSSKRGKQKF